MRRIPDLQVNSTSTKKNYDDNPLIDGQCNKIYPSVSYGGYGYMFIWFCPIHGHTYGFHLIAGGEGRIPSHHFSNSRKKCRNIYSMTLHVGYQSMQ